MDKRRHERMIRWQDYRIQHLSFTINLFLTFGIALIGFCFSKLVDPNEYLRPIIPYIKIVAFIVGYSIFLGIIATITRLIDFRATFTKIQGREIGIKRKRINFISKYIGNLSWGFLWGQIIVLLIAAIILGYVLIKEF